MRQMLAAIVLFALPFQDAPPREAGQFRASDLVELQSLEPSIRLDIRYATINNLARRAASG